MKIKIQLVLVAALGLSLISSEAQPGGGGMGGQKAALFSGAMKQLLGENKAFSAKLEIESKAPSGELIKVPGKIAYNDGKSRMEMDMTKANLPADAMEQMKAMGMDSMVIISRPDKKTSYMIYPGLKAYAEMPIPETETADDSSKYKLETKELGKESVEGQSCVKNKIVITDDKAKKSEFTIWSATDLKKFPVKIESNEGGQPVTMLFKEVKLAKPDDTQFNAPTGFKRYESFMAMMMEQMKAMGGPGGPPQGK